MKYMGDYYATRTTFDLNGLRSKKYNRLQKLDHETRTYANILEAKKLNQQVGWIDAELRARADQLWMNGV